MASIRERPRKDGTTAYAVLYSIDGRQSSLPFDDPKAAEAFKAAVEAHGAKRALEMHGLDAAPRRHDTGMTVKKWCQHHIEHLTGVEQTTIDEYNRYVRRDLGALADIPLARLTEDDISAWVREMETTGGRNGTGVKPKTIRNKHGFLSGALAKAVPRYLPTNPAAGRRLPKGEGDDHEPVFLSRDEFRLLLGEVTEYWHPLVEFLVASGCRWGEAAALKPSDVDRKNHLVSIRRAWKYSPSKGYYLGPPKTKRSKRTIKVKPEVLDKLNYSAEWLFLNRDGGPVRYHGFKPRVWDKAVARAGLDPKPTPHDLRHTHASWMLNDGRSMIAVSRRLGHENIQITIDTYGHLDRSADAEAADSIYW
jgi:integrase